MSTGEHEFLWQDQTAQGTGNKSGILFIVIGAGPLLARQRFSKGLGSWRVVRRKPSVSDSVRAGNKLHASYGIRRRNSLQARKSSRRIQLDADASGSACDECNVVIEVEIHDLSHRINCQVCSVLQHAYQKADLTNKQKIGALLSPNVFSVDSNARVYFCRLPDSYAARTAT